MPHSIVYNGTPIEELEKKELIKAVENCCCMIDMWKESAELWKKKYEAELKK